MKGRGHASAQYRLDAPGAFASLYDEHAHDVLRFLARRTFDAEAAVDLLAETFAQAFDGRGRFRGSSEGEAVAWLYGIARRQLGKYIRRGMAERRALRKVGIERPALTEEDYQRIEELAGVAELRAAIGEHFATLPHDQQQALRLRVLEEQPYDEIARRLSVSEEVARARVSRGLRRLSAALDAVTTEGIEHA